MIDGASYAFLTYFVEHNNLNENIKLIITYKDNRITQGYFYSEKLAQNQYEDIKLAKLTTKEADNLIKQNYITEMNKMFSNVHRILTSYRNTKNYGTSWVSAGGSLWYLRESKFLNCPRTLLNTSCAISGTGFLVHTRYRLAD